MKVLLAEDNLVNQEVAKAMLGQRGVDVHVVEHGKAAIQRLLDGRFDIVFMDVQMPIMDGIEATQEIRRLESVGAFGRQPSEGPIPIVAQTAHILHQDRTRCFEAGMNDFLGKPLDGRELDRVLEKWALPAGIVSSDAKSGGAPAAASSPVPAIWDRVAFTERLLNDVDIMEKVRNAALTFLPAQIQRLQQAVLEQKWPAARDVAHDIKGMAASLGALALKGIAEKIESHMRCGLPVEGTDLNQLDTDCKAFLDCLRGWVFA